MLYVTEEFAPKSLAIDYDETRSSHSEGMLRNDVLQEEPGNLKYTRSVVFDY